MKSSILITGGSGLLAVNWALAVRDRHAVTLGLHQREIRLASVQTAHLDLGSEDVLLRRLQELQPQIVIHAAGLTSVERCEAEPDLAYQVNVTLAENVARACRRLGITLVHVSTDHLFSGDVAQVDETHPVKPLNVYGITKAEAESRVLDCNPSALVVRTNFYGWGPHYRQSFSDRIIGALRTGKEANLFNDVHFTPVLIESLAATVHDLVRLKASGIFHVVGDERISKHEFGIRVAKEFALDARLIKPSFLARQQVFVRRPLEMSLSNEKVCSLLGRRLGTTTEHLARLHQQEYEGLAMEVQES